MIILFLYLYKEKKRREFEKTMWKKMTDKLLDQMKEDQDNLIKQRGVHEARSVYEDTYIKLGFKVKELGTDMDDEVIYSL